MSFLKLYLVISHGVMVMSLRKNKSQASGKLQCCHAQKAHQVKSNLCFFDVRGVLHAEFVPQGQSANQAVSLDVLKDFATVWGRKTCWFFRDIGRVFHHDNAPALAPISERNSLAKISMTHLPHASPHLTFFVPKNKEGHKRTSFWQSGRCEEKYEDEACKHTDTNFKNYFKTGNTDWKIVLNYKGGMLEV